MSDPTGPPFPPPVLSDFVFEALEVKMSVTGLQASLLDFPCEIPGFYQSSGACGGAVADSAVWAEGT